MAQSSKEQIEALKREVLSNPTPQKMVALVERYMAVADDSHAADVAKKAVERFPDSELCVNAYQNVRKIQLQGEVQELNRALRKNPTVGDYERLAGLYLNNLGNRNKAFEIAMEGLTRFPDSDGLHLVTGEIRMSRFHNDFLANDFTEAIRHLQEAVRVNPQNYKALMDLARLYSEVGGYRQAEGMIDKVLVAEPNMQNVPELKAIVDQYIDESIEYVDDILMDIENKRALSPTGVSIREMFEPSARAGTLLQVSPSKMEDYLQGYTSISGYKCSAVLGKEGKVIAAHSRGDIGRQSFESISQRILETVLDSAKKMDIGAFASAEIETPLGRIRLSAWKNLVLALLIDHPAKKEDIDIAVERFVAFASVG